MKENKTTLIKWMVVAGLGLAGGYLFYRKTKKSYKELVAREEANNRLLAEEGLSPEDMEPQPSPESGSGSSEDDNFVKKLYEEVRFESDLDIDCLDTDKIYTNPVSENVVHIRLGRKAGRDMLEFLFEIPFGAYGSGREFSSTVPGIPDFLNSLLGEKKKKSVSEYEERSFREGGLAQELKSILLVTPPAFSQMEGYFFLTFDRKDEGPDYPRCSGMVKIQPEFYRDYADDTQNGLSKYVAKVKLDLMRTKDACVLECESKNIEKVHIEDIILVQKLSFPVATDQHPDGVTLKTAVRCLEYILDEFKVVGNRGGKFDYKYFLFYDPDAYDDVCCYDTKPVGSGKVKVISVPTLSDGEDKK